MAPLFVTSSVGRPGKGAPVNDGFGVENLPLGVARLPDGPTACVSALGEHVIVLSALAHAGVFRDARLPGGVFAQPIAAALPGLRTAGPALRPAAADRADRRR